MYAGAEPSEVACMSTLTTNLHLMMSTFYRPTKERFKILCEAHAFPSDQVSAPSSPTLNGRLTRRQYALISQIKRHGLDVDSTLIEMSAREGEYSLREEDILDMITKHGSEIALVMFSGIQYWSGQLFPIEIITKKGKEMVWHATIGASRLR
jgi:kynureninase